MRAVVSKPWDCCLPNISREECISVRTVYSVTAKMGNIETSAINNNSDWVNLIVRLTAQQCLH